MLKMRKKVGGGPRVGWGGQGGSERRILAIVKMKTYRGRSGQGWGGVQGGCE